jgi:hypothetical protein
MARAVPAMQLRVMIAAARAAFFIMWKTMRSSLLLAVSPNAVAD